MRLVALPIGRCLLLRQPSTSARFSVTRKQHTAAAAQKLKPVASSLVPPFAGTRDDDKRSTISTPALPSGALRVSPFSNLPSINSDSDLLNVALRRCEKLNVASRKKTPKKFKQDLTVRRLLMIHTLLCVRLQQQLLLYPNIREIHPFDRALIQLSISNNNHSSNSDSNNNNNVAGERHYKEVVGDARRFCNRLNDTHQQYEKLLLSSSSMRAIDDHWQQCINTYGTLWQQQQPCIERLRQLTKSLYHLPVLDPLLHTVALVGLPNVGKSSIVRSISSGKPEVQNYSFTTRGIVAGHIQHVREDASAVKIQVTDTPGLLPRADAARKAVELLTLAVLQHLSSPPPLVLIVMDASGHCGYDMQSQLAVRHELHCRFPAVTFIDVYSKCDLAVNSIDVNNHSSNSSSSSDSSDNSDSSFDSEYGDVSQIRNGSFDYSYLEQFDMRYNNSEHDGNGDSSSSSSSSNQLSTRVSGNRGSVDVVHVSTDTQQGIDELKRMIVDRLGGRTTRVPRVKGVIAASATTAAAAATMITDSAAVTVLVK